MCDFELHNISGTPCILLYFEKSNNSVQGIKSKIYGMIDSMKNDDYFQYGDERFIEKETQNTHYIVIFNADSEEYIIIPDIRNNYDVYYGDGKLLVEL